MTDNIANENLKRILTSYRNGTSNQRIMPSVLVVEPSSKCNISCVYCPTHLCEEKGLMTMEMFKKILNQCDNSIKTVLLYFRGEPFIHNKIEDMIKLIKNTIHARVVISTNATLLDECLSRKLIKAKLDDIIFSLDADSAPTYDQIKKCSDFDRVVANITRFITINKEMNYTTNVIVKLVGLSINKDEIPPFINKWVNYGCNVEVSSFNSWANQMMNLNPLQDKSELDGEMNACADLWFKSVITYNGKVVLCCHDFKEREILGDLNYQSLLEIWNSKRIQHLRSLHKKNLSYDIPLCRNCRERSCEEDIYGLLPEIKLIGCGGRP